MRMILAGLMGLSLMGCQAAQDDSAEPAPPTDAAESSASAVTVFTGGTIYTGIGTETVDAVAVDADGRIIATSPPGSSDWDDSEVTLIDLGNGVMFPGFVDGHAHLFGIGQRELTLNLEGTGSVAELVARIAAEVDGVPAGQ
ncbi:MAG: amidohydrolase family protein, partial [Pseudomonadota bacterium]|nr:amidohydrolase family protein [Pseudomonadota bacterium]